MNTVKDEVFAIIAKEGDIELDSITLQSTLHSLQIESLAALEIIFEIEDHFGISLPERDPKFDTASVEGLVSAVERLVAKKNS